MNLDILSKLTREQIISYGLVAFLIIALVIILTIVLTLRNKAEIAKFISDIRDSLYIKDGGYSTRKLMAWFGIWTAASLTLKHSSNENIESLLNAWLIFVATCIGLTVYGNIQEKKLIQQKPIDNAGQGS